MEAEDTGAYAQPQSPQTVVMRTVFKDGVAAREVDVDRRLGALFGSGGAVPLGSRNRVVVMGRRLVLIAVGRGPVSPRLFVVLLRVLVSDLVAFCELVPFA